MSFDFTLGVFVPRALVDEPSLFGAIDAIITPMATDRGLLRWHPYEVKLPYLSLEQFPMAFITQEGVWQEYDPDQEKPAQRLVKRRQKVIAAIHAEEEQAHDEATACARVLVRVACWEADHPFPLGPWRQQWRQALLEHAHMALVSVTCERMRDLAGGWVGQSCRPKLDEEEGS